VDSKLRFLLLCSGIILFALLVFALTGLTNVKKDQVVYLSRHGVYKKTLREGWHYVWPYSYHASSAYGPEIYAFSLRLEKGKKLYFTAKVTDSKAFEFAFPNWKILAKAAYLDTQSPEDPLREIAILLERQGLSIHTLEIR
jgi:hypothetical protein